MGTLLINQSLYKTHVFNVGRMCNFPKLLLFTLLFLHQKIWAHATSSQIQG